MKKIISLIASVAMLATMVSSAFAASVDNNAPVIESTVTEVSAVDFEGMMGAPLEEGQKAYMIAVNASGFDLESKPGTGFGGNAKRTGVLLSTVKYQLVFEDESKFVMAVGMDDGLAPAGSNGLFAGAAWSTAPTMYPVIANTETAGKQVTANDNVYINTFMLVVSGDVTATIDGEFTVLPVTNNTAGASKVFRNDNNNISYTVNGVAAKTITFGEEPIPEDEIIWTDRMDLEAGELKGAAWDVTIKEFDSTKTYVATFTNTANAADVKTLDMDLSYFEGEDGAEVGFVALLKLNKDRVVDLKVTEKE